MTFRPVISQRYYILVFFRNLVFINDNYRLFTQQIFYIRGQIIAEKFVLGYNHCVFVKNKWLVFLIKITIGFGLRYQLGVWIVLVKLVFSCLGKKKLRGKQCGRNGD